MRIVDRTACWRHDTLDREPRKRPGGGSVSALEWLEGTQVALWVGESLWGYPLLLGVHIVGLAVVAGIFLMLDLRVLGFAGTVEYSAFRDLFPLAWAGLALNAMSGLALFSSQATTFIVSVPFLLKIACIAVGVSLAVMLRRRLNVEAEVWDGAGPPGGGAPRLVAALSLLAWVGAIVAGRLIAYL